MSSVDGISDPISLRRHFGPIGAPAARKVLPRLDHYAQAFIRLSPFLVLATADSTGRADASPRGAAPGFVQILSETLLLVPDRPGNTRVDSFHNLLSSSGVGMIFFVPGIDETLRVNGTAQITTDPALLASASAHGKIPRAGLLIAVQEAFFHCGKALKRARLWDPAQHVERHAFPSLGRIIAEQTGTSTVEEGERRIEEAYRTRLY